MPTTNGTTALAARPTDPLAIAAEVGYSPGKLQLVKDTIARGATDDELALFLYTAHRAGLDPLARQIYCIQRWDSTLQRNVMSVQVSIDGLRLIADRTGRYAPGRASTYEYDKNGSLVAATAYVMKYVQGTWHEAAATAYYVEYVQTKKDGTPTAMWKSKPRIMLGKCAEALALRRAFPAELSGIYTPDEMGDDELQPRPSSVLQAHSKALPPGGGQVTEVEAPFAALPSPTPTPISRPLSSSTPADFNSGPTMLAYINTHVEVPFDNVYHLQQAIRAETSNPRWSWPRPGDAAAWQDAYTVARRHADAKLRQAESEMIDDAEANFADSEPAAAPIF